MLGLSRIGAGATGRDEAKRHLDAAYKLAAPINDRMNQIHAATALARLHLEDDRRTEARALLEPMHSALGKDYDAALELELRKLLGEC